MSPALVLNLAPNFQVLTLTLQRLIESLWLLLLSTAVSIISLLLFINFNTTYFYSPFLFFFKTSSVIHRYTALYTRNRKFRFPVQIQRNSKLGSSENSLLTNECRHDVWTDFDWRWQPQFLDPCNSALLISPSDTSIESLSCLTPSPDNHYPV